LIHYRLQRLFQQIKFIAIEIFHLLRDGRVLVRRWPTVAWRLLKRKKLAGGGADGGHPTPPPALRSMA
jgi:hypothetical protein